ncbi:MAG: hypothetical protein NUW01_16025, partial [Gemmatimonadaceae bacterium]|nr:hypothetical protein [Gemmatimonadaceae bacterium]
ARAMTTNVRRLAMIASYGVACAGLRFFGVPIPRDMFLLFASWLAAGVLYHVMLRRTHTSRSADRIQLFGLFADVSYLTGILSIVGGRGGWAESSTVSY